MAKFEINGFDDFALDMEKLARMPGELLDDMITAQADVIEEAQKAKGRVYGVYRTGVTLESIKRGKISKTKDGRSIIIAPRGKNKDGNRNAEVAFVNEYGKKGQQARPFIRDANEQSTDKAVAAAESVYDDWLNKNIGN